LGAYGRKNVNDGFKGFFFFTYFLGFFWVLPNIRVLE
jgi:hypothetical protein